LIYNLKEFLGVITPSKHDHRRDEKIKGGVVIVVKGAKMMKEEDEA